IDGNMRSRRSIPVWLDSPAEAGAGTARDIPVKQAAEKTHLRRLYSSAKHRRPVTARDNSIQDRALEAKAFAHHLSICIGPCIVPELAFLGRNCAIPNMNLRLWDLTMWGG